MLKKMINIVLILVITFSFVTGCDLKKDNNKNNDDNKKVSSIDDLSVSEGTLHCTRKVSIDGGNGSFNYYISYKGDDLTYLKSEESVESDDETLLDTYQDSYESIDSYYEGLKYYDTNIIRTSKAITYRIEIDYTKIDIRKLIEIEGEEDNIFEDNKPKLSKYFDLAKKLGITCSESTL